MIWGFELPLWLLACVRCGAGCSKMPVDLVFNSAPGTFRVTVEPRTWLKLFSGVS